MLTHSFETVSHVVHFLVSIQGSACKFANVQILLETLFTFSTARTPEHAWVSAYAFCTCTFTSTAHAYAYAPAHACTTAHADAHAHARVDEGAQILATWLQP